MYLLRGIESEDASEHGFSSVVPVIEHPQFLFQKLKFCS